MKRPLRTFIAAFIAITPLFTFAQQPDAAAPAAPTTSDNPAVQALLDSNPSTPVDLMTVIGLLLDLKQPIYARPMVVRLRDALADDASADALGRRFGSRAVSRLADTSELQPEGKELADKIRAAIASVGRNPDRIQALMAQLQDPSLDVRAAAVNNLRLGGDVAAQALADGILQATDPRQRQALEMGLAGMGSEAVGPLSVMLTSGDPVATASAVAAFVLMDESEVLDELYVAAFAPSIPAELRVRAEAALQQRFGKSVKPIEAAGRLYLVAEGLYKKAPDPNAPPTMVWRWDAAAKKVDRGVLPSRLDSLRRSARYARTAEEIGGPDPAVRKLRRGAEFESFFWAAASPQELDASIAAWQGAEKPTRFELEALYDQAATNNRVMAAARLLMLLAASAPVDELLVAVGGRPTTLVRAATHPDPNIRFAALSAIFQLNPAKPFPGSSGVADALAWFATGEGIDRALVVDPREGRGRDVAGMLVEMSIRAESTDDPRAALAKAVADADMQIVLMDQVLLEPGQGSLLARLRADYRTARLPVVVLASLPTVDAVRRQYTGIEAAEEHVNRLRSRLHDDPYTLVFVRPVTPDHLQKQFAMNAPPGTFASVEPPQRVERSKIALAAMKGLLETKNPVFNLRSYEQQLLEAATSPSLATAAVGALTYFGSPAAQRALVHTASANARPLDVRQAATTAFCESVIRFGTLLTTDEIRRQYDRYNASEQLDRPTQELLGAILDAIEARAAKIPVKSAAAAVVPPPAP